MQLYSNGYLAKRFRVTPKTIWEWISEGKIKPDYWYLKGEGRNAQRISLWTIEHIEAMVKGNNS
jgi:hypothetical protein